jgi:hypothetical protein
MPPGKSFPMGSSIGRLRTARALCSGQILPQGTDIFTDYTGGEYIFKIQILRRHQNLK